jgi:hypothetical protein
LIKVFTYRITDSDEIQVVPGILRATLADRDFGMFPMPQYSPDRVLVDGDVAVTFGTTPALAVRDSGKAIQHVSLPAPKKLVNKAGNEKDRDDAWNALQDLAKKLADESFSPAQVIVTEADMPDLDKQHLLMLQRLTEKSNSRFCIQTGKNGKTIAIGYDIPIDFEADIKISFEELYTVRNVMDILEVDRVELINL